VDLRAADALGFGDSLDDSINHLIDMDHRALTDAEVGAGAVPVWGVEVDSLVRRRSEFR